MPIAQCGLVIGPGPILACFLRGKDTASDPENKSGSVGKEKSGDAQSQNQNQKRNERGEIWETH